jgi:hypothetical protein
MTEADVCEFELVRKPGEEDQGTIQTAPVARMDSGQLSSLILFPGPSWLGTVARQMVGFLGLENNWDSYGAAVVKRSTVEEAINFLYFINGNLLAPLPQPMAVPTAGGGIQLEWHTKGVDLEIELTQSSEITLFFKDSTQTEEWTLRTAADFKKLEKALGKLTA